MKKILFALALLLTIGAVDAMAQSNPPLSNKRIRMKGQAAAPTPDPPTGYYNLWVDSGSGNLYITNAAGTDTPVGAGISGLTDNVIPQANGTTAIENSKMTTSGTNSGTWTLYDDTATVGISQLYIRSGAGQTTTSQLLIGSTATGLAESAAGILAVTDGSTGQGGIGLSDAATNTVTDALILRHATSDAGFGQDGFGTGLLFQAENSVGTMHDAASIDAVFVDSADTSEDTRLDFNAMVGGASTNLVRMDSSGGGQLGVTATYTDASNYRQLLLSTNIIAGGSAGVLFNGVGTGQNDGSLYVGLLTGSGSLNLVTAGGVRWLINGGGIFAPSATNTFDIGTSSARVADIFAGRLSVYDDTVTTGVSQVSIRAGAGQSTTRELEVLDNAGTARFGFTNQNYTLFVGGTSGIALIGDSTNALTFGNTPGNIYASGYAQINASNITLMRGSTKTLTDDTATTFCTISLPTDTAVGGVIEYTILFSTGGNLEMESGELYFAGTNEAGTELATITENGTNTQTPAGTMTTDFTVSYGTDTMIFSVDANSTALTVNPVITYRVRFNSGAGTSSVP